MSTAPHIPVLLEEVMEQLAPKPGEHIVDGTFGAGGYTRAVLARGARVTALDRDPTAIAAGRAMHTQPGDRIFNLVQGRFGDLDQLVTTPVDGVVLDIGVSSMQLDQAERGFSFRDDGPLDMRMEQSGVSAADVVNTMARQDLTRLIGIWGEERKASAVSGAIERRRAERLFQTTADLAGVVENAVGKSPKDRIHPATRTFQALRIFVNRELHELCRALFAAERLLQEGGRLVVVTFHSLEDRIVKRFFADRMGGHSGSRHLPATQDAPAIFSVATRRPITAGDAELDHNPRSRSAKLRAGVRTAASVPAQSMELFGLPNLPRLDRYEVANTEKGML
ncbi:MAG: 16S rRNA (cytosine(1402)-N(4))-methyltransferase RsmH [Pseudomonadota bacterium]